MNNAADQVRTELRRRFEAVEWKIHQREVGWVVRVGDGVAYLRGAPSLRYAELLKRRDGLTALAFDLRPNEAGVILLDAAEEVRAGDEFRPTGEVASVAVGRELLGRVVDVLGRPLDGGPPLESRTRMPVEREAPGVIDRVPVHEPLHTGITVIDSLLPLGRGQRELILGDRGTGKTAIALDAILAQRNENVVCVYVAIGQRKTTIGEVVDILTRHEAMPYTVVVAADAETTPGRQYLAPYAACTIAEYFMQQGKHVLIVYDDLTKHADAYRRLCLLLGRPPGREAYPADVFYLHSRLLERATRLHERLGGGSLTALPIATTQSGRISGYIPTNLISITDGQIYLDTRLFNEGMRPAVDVGLSVSRVGGKAQHPVLRRLVGDLKLLHAQLRELETFSRFGAELEPETAKRLERGKRLRQILKQARLHPLRMGQEMAMLSALREGLFDEVPVPQITDCLAALNSELETNNGDLLDAVERSDELTQSVADSLKRVVVESIARVRSDAATPPTSGSATDGAS
jgi:F-type H+-transporting ATPase subunit alpha